MELNTTGLRKRRGDPNTSDARNTSPTSTTKPNNDETRSESQKGSKDDTVWGKTDDGAGNVSLLFSVFDSGEANDCTRAVFKVPTTHDVLTLFNPTYPKSHFDVLSLFLLGSQVILFFVFVYLHRQDPNGKWQKTSKAIFLAYFAFWRAMYDGGLGWVLTKQSKKRWIVRWIKGKGWFDNERRPEARDWLRRQLEVKMGKDYSFDVGTSRVNNEWLAEYRL